LDIPCWILDIFFLPASVFPWLFCFIFSFPLDIGYSVLDIGYFLPACFRFPLYYFRF
jgi:hypothetical protein